MKIAEPKTPPRHSSDATAAAAAAHTTAAPAPATTAAPAAACCNTELGFTLQTLIVMAVFTLAAVGVGLGLLAVNSASSSSFEEAGKTGVEARCAPNEVKDPELEARGVAGTNPTYRTPTYRQDEEITADTIGCNPVCATWEYYDPGLAAEGTGGPEGSNGVYSSNEGCFAPCYWNYSSMGRGVFVPHPGHVKGSWSSLSYYDDNRVPIPEQMRLGVNYRRSVDLSVPPPSSPAGLVWQHSDVNLATGRNNKDGKLMIRTRPTNRNNPQIRQSGSREASGSQLAPNQIAAGIPTTFKPNWRSLNPDPGTTDPTLRNGTRWEDENWEIRADPYEKECTIVNMHPSPGYPELVCSSDWDNCEPRP